MGNQIDVGAGEEGRRIVKADQMMACKSQVVEV